MNHVVTFAPFRDHFGEDFRRVLQIGVDKYRRVARAVLESAEKRRLLSEVSRKTHAFEPLVLFAVFGNDFQTFVAAAVVHGDYFKRQADFFHYRHNPFVKCRQTFFFVKNGRNDAYYRFFHSFYSLRHSPRLICQPKTRCKTEFRLNGAKNDYVVILPFLPTKVNNYYYFLQ